MAAIKASDEEVIIWLRTKLDKAEFALQLKALELEVSKVQDINGKANLQRIKERVITNQKLQEADGKRNLDSIRSIIDRNQKLAELDGKRKLQEINDRVTTNQKLQEADGKRSLQEIQSRVDTTQRLREADGKRKLQEINDRVTTNQKLQEADGKRNLKEINDRITANQKAQSLDNLQKIKELAAAAAHNEKLAILNGKANMKYINDKIDTNNRIKAEEARARSKTAIGAIENGTTFGHKVVTTSQYIAAGAGIALVAGSVSSMATAIIEADKALGMFEAVLERTPKQARQLQQEIFKIGETYGGTITDLNESALALGRAGIAGDDLTKSIKAVSQVALLSGDSLANITQLLVSWKTVYPDAKMNDLADSMVGVANATLLSMDDLKTVTTYMLTAGQQAGLTSDSLLALAGSWRQLGKAPSTVGTESRRFFEQITSGADDVKKAYMALGINVDKMKTELAKGGPEAEAAMKQLFKILGSVGQTEGQNAIKGLANILDKATIQSLFAMAKVGKDGLSVYERTLIEAGDKASGKAEEGARKISLTYEKMWERIKNTMTAGSSVFADSLKVGLTGSNTTTGDFNKSLDGLSTSINTVMGAMGSLLGTAIKPFITSLSGLLQLVGGLISVSSRVSTALDGVSSGITEVAASFVAAALIIKVNPFAAIMIFAVDLVMKFKEIIDLQDQIKGNNLSTAASNASSKDISAIGSYKTPESKLDATNKAIVILENRLAKFTSITDEQYNRTDSKTQAKIDNTISILNKRIATLNKLKADLTKVTVKATVGVVTPNISGGTLDLKGSTGSVERDARNLAKDKLDAQLEELRLAEQIHFINSKITDEAAQKYYHIHNTLRDEKALIDNASVGKTGAYRNPEDRRADSLKTEKDIKKGQNELLAIIAKNTVEYEKQKLALDWQLKAVGAMSDEKRIELGYQEKEAELIRNKEQLLSQYSTMGKEGLILASNITNATDAQLKLLVAQTDEQKRQLAQKREMEGLHNKTLDLSAQEYQMLMSKDLVGLQGVDRKREELVLEEKLLQAKQAKDNGGLQTTYDATVSAARAEYEWKMKTLAGQEDYLALLTLSNVAYNKNNSSAQSFMRISESGLSSLSSGLTSYFTIGDEGYGKWSNLSQGLFSAIMKGLLEELVVNQMILQVRQAMASASSSGGGFWGSIASGVAGIFSGGNTSGGAVNAGGSSYTTSTPAYDLTKMQAKGGVNYLAKGGYVNSIVSKPTYVAKGTIAGEAGAEGVLPLQRDSQGRLGVNATGASSGAQSITINIKNESGEELKVTKSEAKTDMSGMVLDIVIDAITRNKKGMRDLVKGGR